MTTINYYGKGGKLVRGTLKSLSKPVVLFEAINVQPPSKIDPWAMGWRYYGIVLECQRQGWKVSHVFPPGLLHHLTRAINDLRTDAKGGGSDG